MKKIWGNTADIFEAKTNWSSWREHHAHGENIGVFGADHPRYGENIG